jgi:hypothetical protein
MFNSSSHKKVQYKIQSVFIAWCALYKKKTIESCTKLEDRDVPVGSSIQNEVSPCGQLDPNPRVGRDQIAITDNPGSGRVVAVPLVQCHQSFAISLKCF